MTLHAWGPDTVLLRLAHLYDARDAALGAPASLTGNATVRGVARDCLLCVPVPTRASSKPCIQVSLAALLSPSSGLRISSAVDMTATGGVPLASLKPVSYTVDGRADPVIMPLVPTAPSGPGLVVTIAPMQVRTFLCGVTPTTGS